MDDDIDGVSRGWAKRLFSTGKIAASAVRLAGRRVLGAEAGEQDGLIAEALAHELDQMKGMAMKVGQILSYFDGVLPEQAHAALRALQRGATPVAFERMAEVIAQAFGQPVDEVFQAFDRRPIAAASIGQVYRAHHEGRAVAVKVQYPGIRSTMAADFSRLGALSRVASLATAVDGQALVDELRQRVDEECDYQREATHQEAFRRVFAKNPQVTIPEVIWDRTRTTVLTTEWCEGSDFYAFVESASAQQRNQTARILAGFAFESLFRVGAVNADPHPGNYLFPQGGGVVFLDFGCVRRFEVDFLRSQKQLMQVVVEDCRSAFDDALVAAGMVAKRQGFDFDFHWRFMCQELAPYRSPHFVFTASWMRQMMEQSKRGNPNLRKMSIPPQWVWLQRLTWGLHAVLVRLGAEGNFAALMRDAMAAEADRLAFNA